MYVVSVDEANVQARLWPAPNGEYSTRDVNGDKRAQHAPKKILELHC